ncbi:putative GPR1/FUN34/yaaH family, partial [Leishmania naiffi]
MSNANVSALNPPNAGEGARVFPNMRDASAVTQVFKSCESLADQMRDNLRSPRSGVSYNYLTTSEGIQRLHTVDSGLGRQTRQKPSNLRSCDYLDEDQNRALSTRHTRSHNRPSPRHGDSSCFDSDSDEEEHLINHQIRMLEAKQAAANMCKSANPGPVGLLGFGLSTILLNLHNTGRFPLSTVIVAMGIALGGGAQVIVGLLEWVRGNTFAHVAFTSYGAFWLSLVLVWLLPNTA